MDVESEAVSFGVHFIRLCRVFELLQHFARSNAPPFIFDADEGRRVVVSLEKVRGFEMSGEVRRNKLFVLAAILGVGGSMTSKNAESEAQTYNHGAFTPSPIPVPRDVADPIALTPYARTDRDLGVELDAHLEIALEDRFRDRE